MQTHRDTFLPVHTHVALLGIEPQMGNFFKIQGEKFCVRMAGEPGGWASVGDTHHCRRQGPGWLTGRHPLSLLDDRDLQIQ